MSDSHEEIKLSGNVVLMREDAVKREYKLDPTSSSTFSAILDLATLLVVLKRWANNRYDVDEIASDAATTVWNRVLLGTTISSWTYYITQELKSSRRSYYSTISDSMIMDYHDPLDIEEYRKNVIEPMISESPRSTVTVIDYMYNLSQDILEVVKESTPSTDELIIRGVYLSVLHHVLGTYSLVGLPNTKEYEGLVMVITEVVNSRLLSKVKEVLRDNEDTRSESVIESTMSYEVGGGY